MKKTEEEMVLKCTRLERAQQEFDDKLRKLERQESEYEEDTLIALGKISEMEEDCYGDKELLNLVEEQHGLLRKIKQEGEELQKSFRSERIKAQRDCEEKIRILKEGFIKEERNGKEV